MSGTGSLGQEPKYLLPFGRAGQVDEATNGERLSHKGAATSILLPATALPFFPFLRSLFLSPSLPPSLLLLRKRPRSRSRRFSRLAFRLLHRSCYLTCNPFRLTLCLAVTDADAAPSAAAGPPARKQSDRWPPASNSVSWKFS